MESVTKTIEETNQETFIRIGQLLQTSMELIEQSSINDSYKFRGNENIHIAMLWVKEGFLGASMKSATKHGH